MREPYRDPPEYLADTAIAPEQAGSLPGLFAARVAAMPDKVAYRYYDNAEETWKTLTWHEVAQEVARYRAALAREAFSPGDRVAVMLRNSPHWVIFDLAAMSLGLVVVPLYLDDRPENASYILEHAQARLLFVEGRVQHRKLDAILAGSPSLRRVVSLTPPEAGSLSDPRLVVADAWLAAGGSPPPPLPVNLESLASIVYTSGTTGRPKGVMLSHGNILWNIWYTLHCGPFSASDVFLSFLPMSHTLERTAGVYLPMALGAEVAYARSVLLLAHDLETIRPTVLISVPRIYERFHARIRDALEKKPAIARWLFELTVEVGWHRFEWQQGRARWQPKLLLWPLLQKRIAAPLINRFGGRLRFAVSGGAALSPTLARVFIGLGLPLYQGYGLTETSPVITVNRPKSNIPASIGLPLPHVEVRLADDGELLTRSRCVMQGYWADEAATRATIDAEGWLHTGDKARLDEYGHYHIVGRIKEIIVLSNGEKVPPADMESAITLDPLFAQVLVVGEARPCLVAVASLDREHWPAFARELGVDPADPAALTDGRVQKALLARIGERLRDFPGYAQIRRVHATLDEWTVDNGLLTPTLKMKRGPLTEKYRDAIAALYADLRADR
jgi:long-chain acyl-CoA synthetase